jgi:hypothetical protein
MVVDDGKTVMTKKRQRERAHVKGEIDCEGQTKIPGNGPNEHAILDTRHVYVPS